MRAVTFIFYLQASNSQRVFSHAPTRKLFGSGNGTRSTPTALSDMTAFSFVDELATPFQRLNALGHCGARQAEGVPPQASAEGVPPSLTYADIDGWRKELSNTNVSGQHQHHGDDPSPPNPSCGHHGP